MHLSLHHATSLFGTLRFVNNRFGCCTFATRFPAFGLYCQFRVLGVVVPPSLALSPSPPTDRTVCAVMNQSLDNEHDFTLSGVATVRQYEEENLSPPPETPQLFASQHRVPMPSQVQPTQPQASEVTAVIEHLLQGRTDAVDIIVSAASRLGLTAALQLFMPSPVDQQGLATSPEAANRASCAKLFAHWHDLARSRRRLIDLANSFQTRRAGHAQRPPVQTSPPVQRSQVPRHGQRRTQHYGSKASPSPPPLPSREHLHRPPRPSPPSFHSRQQPTCRRACLPTRKATPSCACSPPAQTAPSPNGAAAPCTRPKTGPDGQLGASPAASTEIAWQPAISSRITPPS